MSNRFMALKSFAEKTLTEKKNGEANTYEAKMIASGLVDKQRQVYNGFNHNYFSVIKFYSKRPLDEWRSLVLSACKILKEHPTKAHLCQLFMDLRTEQFEKDQAFAVGNDYVVVINGIEVDRITPTDKQIEYSEKRMKEYYQFFEELGADVCETVFEAIEYVEAKIEESEKLKDELMYG